jgi:hypothetical protein
VFAAPVPAVYLGKDINKTGLIIRQQHKGDIQKLLNNNRNGSSR